MNKILLILSLIVLGACSSTPEKMEPAAAPVVADAPAPVEAAPAPAPAPADPMEKMVKDTAGMFPDIEGTERMAANCNMGGDSRTVTTIDIADGGGCGVVYGKGGAKQTVAMAKWDMGFCDKVFENIKGNLENGGFDCGGGGSSSSAEEPAAAEPAAATEEPAKAEGQ